MSGIKAHFKGTVTHDPELKYTNNSGTAYCRVPIACNWREQGEQRTQYVDATAWGRTAEFASSYIRRGSRVVVDLDRIYNRQYARNSDGATMTSLSGTVVELDLIDWPEDDQKKEQTQQPADTGGFNDVNFDDPLNAAPAANGHDSAPSGAAPAPAQAPAQNPQPVVEHDDPFDDDPPF